ncbi:MAG TPA: DUF2817 domain-containing protein [Phycisphaerae bacterium]|mgnify:FL=1|nr:DUF2817 domain-containing protein [Phycisphaerae bacterium]
MISQPCSISRLAWAAALSGLLTLTACGPKPEPVRHEPFVRQPPRVVVPPPPPPPPPPKPAFEEIVFGHSVGGRPLTAEIHGDGEDIILILATIHGNETAGTPLVRKLSEYLVAYPEILEGKRVILVPVANPDGMAANRRTNARGVDLNRNFPAWNYSATGNHGAQPLSEPESRALHELIVKYPPRRIISIHQPLNCIDYDGPAEGLARAMATSSRLPLKKLGSLAGSLGSFAGISLNTPIITVEFARSADDLSPETLWARYGRMLLVGICYPESAPSLAAANVAQATAESSDPSARTLGK